MEPISQLSGAALGVALQQLRDSIIRAIARSSSFKFKLKLLQTTIDILIPRFKAIQKEEIFNQFPGAEAQRLLELLVKASGLVSTCSDIPWYDLRKKRRYEKRIDELDESLKHLLTLNFQLLQYDHVLTILSKVNEMSKKLLADHDRTELGDQYHQFTTSPSHGVPAVNDQQNLRFYCQGTSSQSQPSTPARFRMSYERKSRKVTKFEFGFS